jgi:hypothetical protein
MDRGTEPCHGTHIGLIVQWDILDVTQLIPFVLPASNPLYDKANRR